MTYPNPIDPRTDARAQAKAAKAYAKATRPWYRMKRTWVGGLLALVVVGSLASPDAAEPTRVAPAPVATRSAGVATPAVSAEPTTAAPVASTEPAKPTRTVSQTQAVKRAEAYLRYTATSRTWLIKQLEYEEFSKADATVAVDNITVDWMEQAAKSAKQYMDYSSFSRKSLIKQLEYEGFTTAQAAHGATSVGL